MVLNLTLDAVDVLNCDRPIIVNQTLERVRNIVSNRFIEQLFEDTLVKLNQKF